MAQPYIPFYMGDYDKDTGDLTLLEHGAYFRLLSFVWSSGNSIATKNANAITDANAYAIAYRIAKAFDDDEQMATQKVLQKYFSFKNGEWSHKRAVFEFEKANKKRTQNAKIATEGWEKRRAKKANADANAYANDMRTHMQPEPEPNIDLRKDHTHTEAQLLEGVCVSDQKIEVKTDPPPLLPEPKKDPEPVTPIEIAARSGLLYAIDTKHPSLSQSTWIEGFLKVQIPLVQAERPEIPLEEISKLWRETVDVMASENNTKASYAKGIFQNKLDRWTPKQAAAQKAKVDPKTSSFVPASQENVRLWREGKTLAHNLRNIKFEPTQLIFDDLEKVFKVIGTDIKFQPNLLRLAGPFDTAFQMV